MSKPNGKAPARTMTIPEVAREAGVSKAAAYRWIADGKLGAYRFPGAGKKQSEILRVDRKEFEAFMNGVYERGPL
jgi:excisionase family DNA binding protein